MASGGARNRSGPAPDPMSGRSDRRGLQLSALPNEGHKGNVPKWPLSPRQGFTWERTDEGRKVQVPDDAATEQIAEREHGLWSWAWSTPQAAAWAVEPWRWPTVAMWVRTFVICEGSEATAADKNSLHRFADQIGLTPAGLAENGWQIATPQIAPADDDEEQPVERQPRRARDRLKVASGGGT